VAEWKKGASARYLEAGGLLVVGLQCSGATGIFDSGVLSILSTLKRTTEFKFTLQLASEIPLRFAADGVFESCPVLSA